MTIGADEITVSVTLFAVILSITLGGLISLIAYLFRQNARSNEALARTAAELLGIDKRVGRLEDRIFPTIDVGRGNERERGS